MYHQRHKTHVIVILFFVLKTINKIFIYMVYEKQKKYGLGFWGNCKSGHL